jgi:hypothetical protein
MRVHTAHKRSAAAARAGPTRAEAEPYGEWGLTSRVKVAAEAGVCSSLRTSGEGWGCSKVRSMMQQACNAPVHMYTDARPHVARSAHLQANAAVIILRIDCRQRPNRRRPAENLCLRGRRRAYTYARVPTRVRAHVRTYASKHVSIRKHKARQMTVRDFPLGNVFRGQARRIREPSAIQEFLWWARLARRGLAALTASAGIQGLLFLQTVGRRAEGDLWRNDARCAARKEMESN